MNENRRRRYFSCIFASEYDDNGIPEVVADAIAVVVIVDCENNGLSVD